MGRMSLLGRGIFCRCRFARLVVRVVTIQNIQVFLHFND